MHLNKKREEFYSKKSIFNIIIWRFERFGTNFPKSITPPWVFFKFFKFFEWHQIAQNMAYCNTFQTNVPFLKPLKTKYKSSHRRCSMQKAVLKNFAIFTGKQLLWILFPVNMRIFKEHLFWRTSANRCFCKYFSNIFRGTSNKRLVWSGLKEKCLPMLSCEICEIFKGTNFEEHLQLRATGLVIEH